MNKLFLLPLIMLPLLLTTGGCTMMGGLNNDYHESKATVATFTANHETFDTAILKAAQKAGYKIKETSSNPNSGSYEGSGLTITYRIYKYDGEDHIKAYIRAGYIGGDREKEKELIADIRKELGEP